MPAGTNWLTSQFIICKDADLEWANGESLMSHECCCCSGGGGAFPSLPG